MLQICARKQISSDMVDFGDNFHGKVSALFTLKSYPAESGKHNDSKGIQRVKVSSNSRTVEEVKMTSSWSRGYSMSSVSVQSASSALAEELPNGVLFILASILPHTQNQHQHNAIFISNDWISGDALLLLLHNSSLDVRVLWW